MSESTQESETSQEVAHVPLPKNARIRQLCNGQYIGEVRHGFWPFYSWRGADSKAPGLTWSTSSIYYKDCLCDTYEEALNALAATGVDKGPS